MGFKMSVYGPEEIFGHRRVAGSIRIRESIAIRGLSPANAGQSRPVDGQCIAHVVQTQSVCELGVEHRHYMVPRSDGAGYYVVLARDLRHKTKEELKKDVDA